jgi:hypothetical protein
MALSGDPKAMTEFRECIEGKTPQRPPEKEPKDGPVTIRVVYDKEELGDSPAANANIKLVSDKSSG